MNQNEKRLYLIRQLIKEDGRFPYNSETETMNSAEQKNLLRSLINIRMPAPVSEDFLTIQDTYLQQEIVEKGITELSELKACDNHIYIWQGDITTLACDAIVNAANSQMLGCFRPLHNCIDNCIHTFAGIQLRMKCAEIMDEQGYEEPTGSAKITPAYNLPCRYILHTVGPIVNGNLTQKHCEQLHSCYRSCLELAEKNNVQSIAFCCISTGVFGFPQREAAEIAVQTVKDYQSQTGSGMKVIFNVFKEEDKLIYENLFDTTENW